MRKITRGFALFDALLAVILMTIAAAGSYTLIKSFRVNSATQQLIRYSTTISQNYMPFLDEGSSSPAIKGDALSSSFLNAIGIPQEEQIESSNSGFYYVNSGMYDTSGNKSKMSFTIFVPDSAGGSQQLANHFLILVPATGSQVNQVLQSASSLFSIYCPTPGAAKTTACVLNSTPDAMYDLWLVFPKSGNTWPPAA